MNIGGLPEDRVGLDEEKKSALREIVAEMRRAESSRS